MQNQPVAALTAATNQRLDNPAPDARPASVAILLCTFHGQRFLRDQLESFAAQGYPHWVVWASDDGSADDTHRILEAYQHRWGEHKLSIHFGPAEGFAANFLSLSCHASIEADYYAYSDQDDIWEPDKLQRALAWLQEIPSALPAMYCSRTRLVDANDRHLGYSPLFRREPSFKNALLQSIGGGNTLVFNQAARHLLKEAGPNVDVITHDWWLYLLVSGSGGKVFYDPTPTIRYRQHDDNLVGENISFAAKLKRLKQLMQGQLREAIDRNLIALDRVLHRLSAENRQVYLDFKAARQAPLPSRLIQLRRLGLYRQTWLDDLVLMVATLFNKV